MKPKGKRVKHSPYINFSEWNLTAKRELSEAFEKIFERCLAEACEVASEEYELNAFFPKSWDGYSKKDRDGLGGKCPDDPTTIYVQLPLGDDEYEGPTWSFKFSELIDYIVEGNGCDEKEMVDPKQAKQVREIIEGLKIQIKRLEDALIAGELE